MSDKKKEEPEEQHVSFGIGDEQQIGFQQEPDGHGWTEEEVAARTWPAGHTDQLEIGDEEPEPEPEEDKKPKAKAVEMDTGVKASK